MRVCMYLCMCVCMYVCMDVGRYARTYVCMYICMHADMPICAHKDIHDRYMHECIHTSVLKTAGLQAKGVSGCVGTLRL